MLNGRAGKTGGDFTQHENGLTVIDYVFVSWSIVEEVNELCVLNICRSDHSPVGLNIGMQQHNRVERDDAPTVICLPADEKSTMKELLSEHPPPPAPDDMNTNDFNDTLKHNLLKTASELGYTKKRSAPLCRNKPWYDKDCKTTIKLLRSTLLSINRSSAPSEERITELKQARKNYKALTQKKKKEYYEGIQNTINSASNPTEFWRALKLLYPRTTNNNPFKPQDSDAFYRQTLPPKIPYDELPECMEVPELDSAIETDKLIRAIKGLKNGKSPGLDGISNEALKSLTPKWLNYLTEFFNGVLLLGKVPEEWSTIEIAPLLKQGDPSDPGNYRGIALISCIAKLFTSILNTRLTEWAESRGLIPECQAGFRRGRGCTDQIFSLASIINIHTRRKKGRAFVNFVDFKRCFDSIDHNLLWRNIASLGVSGKMLRVIRNLYEHAAFRVRTSSGHSSKAAVSEGVLQGVILSPLLFSLFVSDIEKFLRSKGVHGLSITEREDALLLMYADDAAILSNS